jgi:hypothetical protein
VFRPFQNYGGKSKNDDLSFGSGDGQHVFDDDHIWLHVPEERMSELVHYTWYLLLMRTF